MNAEIEQIFSNFIVNDKQIPVEFLDYQGSEETYIVYSSLGEEPSFFGDNEVLVSEDTYDFDIYTKGNFLDILKQLKKILNENGWTWIEDSEDLYEKDTGYFHKATTWSKERMI